MPILSLSFGLYVSAMPLLHQTKLIILYCIVLIIRNTILTPNTTATLDNPHLTSTSVFFLCTQFGISPNKFPITALAYGVERNRRDVGDGSCIAVAHGYKHMLLDKITDSFRREGTRRMESTLDRRHTHIRHCDELIHQSPRLPADYVQSIEQVAPRLIARIHRAH